MPVTPIVIAGAWQVRMVFSYAGIAANVVNYVASSNPLTQAKADAVADVFRNNWVTYLKPRSMNLVQLTQINVTDVTSATGPVFSKNYTDIGTLTTEFLPPQTAAVITWRTALRGRSYRGRSYFGGFCEVDSAGQTVSATLVTALGNYATNLRAGLTTLGNGLVVGSRLHHTCEPVTGHTVRPYWRTQRRRTNPY